jgi:hypothetical protein
MWGGEASTENDQIILSVERRWQMVVGYTKFGVVL